LNGNTTFVAPAGCSSPQPPSSTPGGGDCSSWPLAEQPAIAVDMASPTTTIQIRFPVGGPQRYVLNRTHQVLDLRSSVERTLRERGAPPRTYTLIAGFPPVTVDDDMATLEAAGLLNASVTLRW
jgi:hypothetical protein